MKKSKKINVLVDEKTFEEFKALCYVKNTSPTQLLEPSIKTLIDNNRTAINQAVSARTNETIPQNEEQNSNSINISNTDHAEHKENVISVDNNNINLIKICQHFKAAIFTADNGEKYLRYQTKTTQALTEAKIKLKIKQPTLKSKKQRGYLLPETITDALESPTTHDKA